MQPKTTENVAKQASSKQKRCPVVHNQEILRDGNQARVVLQKWAKMPENPFVS